MYLGGTDLGDKVPQHGTAWVWSCRQTDTGHHAVALNGVVTDPERAQRRKEIGARQAAAVAVVERYQDQARAGVAMGEQLYAYPMAERTYPRMVIMPKDGRVFRYYGKGAGAAHLDTNFDARIHIHTLRLS